MSRLASAPQPREATNAAYEKLELLIGGTWCSGSTGQSEPVINPANETVLGHVPHASPDDLDRALDAAAAGFEVWRNVSAYDRAAMLAKACHIIRDRAESLALTMTLEQGKPLRESRTEVAFAADVLEWYAQEGRRAYGRIIPSRDPGEHQLVEKEPIGPVAALTPWNFPATTPLRKIGGALAAGCSCIIKPSEETPGIAIGLARALQDAGLPDGVLNVVFGVPEQVSSHLLRSPVIRKVTFTGPTGVGRHLARLAADGLKVLTMELGGHAPVVVFDDVDVERVAEMSAIAKFRNGGQICIAPTRFYVQRDVYRRFVDAFVRHVSALRVGDGTDESTEMGPLANRRRIKTIEELIADAREHGAKVVTGGSRLGERGYFFAPTVLTDVPADARVMRDEPFGPLAVVQPFETLDDAIAQANRLPYGLAAYGFSRSAARARSMATRLEAGMVGINQYVVARPEAPFGGIKDSGYGSECGIEGLESFLTTKFVARMDMF